MAAAAEKIDVIDKETQSKITPTKIIPIEDRTITVIHFLNGEELPLKNTKKYCNLNMPLKFKVIYHAIDRATTMSPIARFFLNEDNKPLDENDILMIYFNPLIEHGRYMDNDMQRIFFQFLIDNKDKLINISTVIFYVAFDYFKSNSNLFDDEFMEYMDHYRVIGLDILSQLKTTTTFLNVSFDPHFSKKMTTFVFGDTKVLIRRPLTQMETANDILECQWWFSDEILKGFGCGKGRLLQQTGTCYLTAVVNGLLLSDSARGLCLKAMVKQLENDDKLKETVMKPITDLACPSFSQGRLAFFYNVLYNTVVKKPRDKILNTLDIFVHASAKYFSAKPTITDPANVEYGQGGYSPSALINLLLDMNVSGFIYIPEFAPTIRYHNFVNIDVQDNVTLLLDKLRNNEYKSQVSDQEQIIKMSHRNCLVTIYSGTPISRVSNEIIAANGNKFLLCFGIIVYFYKDVKTEKVGAHAMVGLLCNDVPIVYDSDTNRFIDCNWRRFDEKKNQDIMLRTMVEMSAGSPTHFSKFQVYTAFYVNETAISKL